MKNKSSEDPDDMSYEDFVVWFMEENKKLIARYVYRRLIPNRYAPSDVRAYFIERVLDILKKRKEKGRPIREPKLYFKKLIDFYCIEYQRMHGYIYGMPKRPRCPQAEEEISQYGFIYFPTDEDSTTDNIPQLGYIDASLGDTQLYGESFQIKRTEPDQETEVWRNLMSMVLPEDKRVLSCIFRRNMSVPEVSRHLNIAISTAYARRERGLRCISGTLSSFVDLDQDNWRIIQDIDILEDEDVSIDQFYNNVGAS